MKTVLAWLEYASKCIALVTRGVRSVVDEWPPMPNSTTDEKKNGVGE